MKEKNRYLNPINILRTAFITALLAGCSPSVPPVKTTPIPDDKTTLPTVTPSSPLEKLILLFNADDINNNAKFENIKAQYSLHPIFPLPANSIESIKIDGFDRPQDVVKTDVLAKQYGIEITPRKIEEIELVEDKDIQFRIRANSDLFQKIFGRFYEYTQAYDSHVIPKIQIVPINKKFLCGNKNDSNDLLPVKYTSAENIAALNKFLVTLQEKGYTQLPIINTPGYIFNYQLGGKNTLEKNVQQLKFALKWFSSFEPDLIKKCGQCYSKNKDQDNPDSVMRAYAQYIYPEFVYDKKGEVVIAPDGIPLVYLKATMYIAVDVPFEEENIDLPGINNPILINSTVGKTFNHELEHFLINFAPKKYPQIFNAETQSKRAGEVYINSAFDKLLNDADDSMFLFILQIPGRGDGLAKSQMKPSS
jgi:hypothetical protein